MKRNSVLVVVIMMMMALWMTTGYAHAADTCEGYDEKRDVKESGSGTFDVVDAEGNKIGSITWDNDTEPEKVSWSVADGYSLEVCVKGGDALATGSGQTGTLTPPKNDGGETPAVSHFAWTVVVVDDTEVVEKETEDDKKKVVEKETEDDKKKVVEKETEDDKTNVVEKETEDDKTNVVEREDEGEDRDDVEVAVADSGADADAAAQITQVPAGAASAGGGSTSGMENAQLFVLGLILMATAGPVLVFARRASRSA